MDEKEEKVSECARKLHRSRMNNFLIDILIYAVCIAVLLVILSASIFPSQTIAFTLVLLVISVTVVLLIISELLYRKKNHGLGQTFGDEVFKKARVVCSDKENESINRFGYSMLWILFILFAYTVFCCVVISPVITYIPRFAWINKPEYGIPLSIVTFIPMAYFLVKMMKKVIEKVNDMIYRHNYFIDIILHRVVNDVSWKERRCFNCDLSLIPAEYINSNMQPSFMPVNQQEKMLNFFFNTWQNDKIELYCCGCFTRAARVWNYFSRRSENDEK